MELLTAALDGTADGGRGKEARNQENDLVYVLIVLVALIKLI